MATVNEKMTAIADSIRDKTGGTEALTLDDMASGVNEVYNVGYSQHEKDFWKDYMREGVSTVGMFAGSGWNEENFKPIRDFNVNQNTFYNHNASNGNPYDLVEHLKKYNVKITQMVNARQCFYFAQFTHLPILDASKTTGDFYNTFNGMRQLTKIDKIIFNSEGANAFSSAFQYCQSLKDLTIEGVIGRSVNLSACPLAAESIKSIITHLKDYSGTENAGAYTLTLKDSCKSLMAQQGAVAELDGKTYDAYIADKGWNLA